MHSRCGLRANFARVLKRWRLEHHLNQKELAGKLGYGHSIVSGWETEARFPDVDTMEYIILYTGITPCRLFCDRADRCAPGQCALLTSRA